MVLRNWEVTNCYDDNDTKSGTLQYNVSVKKEASLSFTVGAGASLGVKAAVGDPLVTNAEATIGVSTSISITAGGSYSVTETDLASWDYSVPGGEKHRARVVASWVDGFWGGSAHMWSWYFDNGTGSWENTSCDNVTGESESLFKYKLWQVEHLPDQDC